MLVQQHLFPHIDTYNFVHAGFFTSSWKLNKLTPGHLQRENAQLEHAEAPYSHLARYRLEEFAFGDLSANQMQNVSMMAIWMASSTQLWTKCPV